MIWAFQFSVFAMACSLIAHQLNGKVERAQTREYGKAEVAFRDESLLVKG